ncbi:unnamed protein product [Spirodela intermedia]|uniref:Uncharacterized protein n=1 Tax=Spirodela intermedia TaxID=51605 RepID=A0A7I8KKK2_SPIIN|nr:unnamed protein product [Spirodela intermedia]
MATAAMLRVAPAEHPETGDGGSPSAGPPAAVNAGGAVGGCNIDGGGAP